MQRIASTESFDQIVETMRYLGYMTHDQNGITNVARATAFALKDRLVASVMLPTFIADEYVKQLAVEAVKANL